MANDDILWKNVDALKQESQPTQKLPATERRMPLKPSPPKEVVEVHLTGKEPGKKNAQDLEHTDTETPRNHATTVSRHRDTTTPAMVESIRKAVKLVGKEAATHRFTPEEKQAIADIIYTYRRQGYDTSENEIARIAINWLVWDYQEKGQHSVLAHILTALKD